MRMGSINSRLGVGFGITLILIFFIGLLGIVNVVYLSSLANEMYEHPLTVGIALLEANGKIVAMHRSMKDVVLSKDPESLEEAIRLVASSEREVQELFERIKDKYLGNPEHIEEAQRTFSEWKAIRDEVIALMKAGRGEEAADITRGRGAQHVARIQAKMNALIEFSRNKANEFLAQANGARDTVTMLMALFLSAALVLGIVVAVIAISENVKNLNKLNGEIAERKSVEKDLEKSRDRLVIANKELESFSYSVSHDLKNPLRNIMEYVKILKSICSQHVDQDGMRFLMQIESSTQKMNALIDDLLDLSRISQHKLSRTEVNLTAIVTRIFDDLRKKEPEREAILSIEKDVSAEADEGLIWIALQNLLDNAWKFTKNRKTTEIQFGVTVSGGKKTYFVKDNGAGFNSLKADVLFQPFQRLHSMKEYQGTGIGLATVQRIIHRHGGRIRAEGKPDEGATFYFTLSA